MRLALWQCVQMARWALGTVATACACTHRFLLSPALNTARSHVVSREAMLLGMGLIIASQCVQAAQITFEDFFMVRA